MKQKEYLNSEKATLARSKGGRVMAVRQQKERWQRIFDYNKNPNLCKQCNKQILATISDRLVEIKQKQFCSHSCSANYSNSHRTTGTGRAKLEIWLEMKLKELYPKEKIVFNDKKSIGYELDIFFPDRKLAFELNGIFHFEPIFGNNNLQRIQENDQRKFKLCSDAGIALCIIDTSSQRVFKESSSKKYLDIIQRILAI